MTRDVEVLEQWIQTCLIIAAFFTTAFPVLYAIFPWYTTRLGRLLMLQAISFAIAMDLSVLFRFWIPEDVVVLFWIRAIALGLIAVSSMLLTGMLLDINRKNKQNQRDYKRRKTDV